MLLDWEAHPFLRGHMFSSKITVFLWDDFILVLEKLGQQSQKSKDQRLVVFSVGPNKMHVWRPRGCSYNYPYLQNLKSKNELPTGKDITICRTVFLRILFLRQFDRYCRSVTRRKNFEKLKFVWRNETLLISKEGAFSEIILEII